MTENTASNSAVTPPRMQWTRERYDQCVEAGIFTTRDKIELLDGEIFAASPQYTPHSVAVTLVEEALRAAFGNGFVYRVQMPLALDDLSEPEPDVAVVTGGPRDYLKAHPSKAELIVEVADSSLEYDRTRKRSAYARNGVPEYWIINLPDHVVEVFRQPKVETADYAERLILRPGQVITPLARPGDKISVNDLLP